MPSILIQNAGIVNEGKIFRGSVLIENQKIKKIYPESETEKPKPGIRIIDATNLYLLPGVIDDQVHFREPGLTHKGDIYSESKAAVAGGITSFMEMPNTVPNALSQNLLEQKYRIAAERSLANFSFYMGTSNENIDEVLKTDPGKVCGVKIFMGASTGNMLVDKRETLELLFSQCKMLIATHCEDEGTIRGNTAFFKEKFGDHIPVKFHPEIRNGEACYKSSALAVELASRYNSRLHVLHLSTAKELDLFSGKIPLKEKKITAEVCVHHLWFCDEDYESKGSLIKWNPAIKTSTDRQSLFEAVLNDKIDVIATDHAPHTSEEKQNSYFKCPSGGPMVQHSLTAMLEFYHQGKISLEKIVQKMSHNPADLFCIENRGYIREGFVADLTLVDLNQPWTVEKPNILYKCGWSPFEGQLFRSKVTHTFVNGNLVFENGIFDETSRGCRLTFSR